MKKFTQNLLLLLMAFSVLTLVSCGEDEEDIFGGDPDEDPTSEFDARLNTTDTLSATVFLSDVDDSVIDVFMSFSSSDETMRRLYATQNVQDQGAVEFDLALGDADKKADGSLELDGPQGESFAVNLDISTAGLPAEILPKDKQLRLLP